MKPGGKSALYFVLGLVLLVVGCNAVIAPLVYFAKAFGGRVIDAESGQPIEGAVVVAEWRPYYLLFVDRSTPIKVSETVTDAQGHYSFPGWGPRLRLWTERLDYLDPEIVAFKTGYQARIEANKMHRNAYVRFSDWDGVTLEFAPFRGTPKERLDQLDFVLSVAGWDRKLPRSLSDEILKERSSLGRVDKPFFDNVERLKEGR